MTFTEAAEAVLRKSGRPLTYKKITQLAIDQNLLSHVGKTPEVTMSTRLATLTKKDDPSQNILRVKPGVFGLREWGSNISAEAADDEVEARPASAPSANVDGPAARPDAPAARSDDRPAPRGDKAPPRNDKTGRNDGRGDKAGRNDGRGDKAGRNDGRNDKTPRVDGRNDKAGRNDGRNDKAGRNDGRNDKREGGDRRNQGRNDGPRRDQSGRPNVSGPAPTITAPSELETEVRAPLESIVAPRLESAANAIGESLEGSHPATRAEAQSEHPSAARRSAFEVEALHASASEASTSEASTSEASTSEASTNEGFAAEPVAAEEENSAVASASVDVSSNVESAAADLLGETFDAPIAERVVAARTEHPKAPTPSRASLDETPREADEIEREERLAASQDMFPEEDDDEEPLLGGTNGTSTDADNNRRRRRRRRGRGRPDGRDGTIAPADGSSDSSAPEVSNADSVEQRPARDENRDRDRDRDRDREVRRERDEAPRDEDVGRDAADLLVSLLSRREDRQPVPMRNLVDEALRVGRLVGDPMLHVPALTAAARVDTARRAARGERPRLRVTGGRVGLMDWTLPSDLVRAESDALVALERLREAARRYVVRRMNELPQASFTEVAVMLLERMGVSSLKAARRPGLPQGEVHLSGIARRGPEELAVAIVIKRGGEVGRERVIELRGSLHHYGSATVAWILTTGNLLSGARDEAAQPGASPVSLFDANALGRLLDENAVLVSHASVTIPWLDVDLYDLLRGS